MIQTNYNPDLLYEKDFELLVSLGVFHSPLMNDAICRFKCAEYVSLKYVGINNHASQAVGTNKGVLRRKDGKEGFLKEPVRINTHSLFIATFQFSVYFIPLECEAIDKSKP